MYVGKRTGIETFSFRDEGGAPNDHPDLHRHRLEVIRVAQSQTVECSRWVPAGNGLYHQ